MTKIPLQDQLEHYELALMTISNSPVRLGLGMCKAIEEAMKFALSRTYNSDIYFNTEEHTVFYAQSLLLNKRADPYFFPLDEEGNEYRKIFLKNCINKCKELINDDGN